MICRNIKCKAELPDNALFCHRCGKKQIVDKSVKSRGNGQGTVYKLPDGKYKAVATKVYLDESGKKRRKTCSKVYTKRKDALSALPSLRDSLMEKSGRKPRDYNITFKQLYDKWFPTHRASKSTLDCYKSAIKHFLPIWDVSISDVDVDDLQDCIDSCGKGKRTQQNMRTTCGLMYKFGIPRHYIPNNLNLSPYLTVGGDASVHRVSFSKQQIEKIKDAAGKTPYADYIYCMIYLGFRPSEALSLRIEQYNEKEKCFVAGAKTEAGINRTVTISPKIQSYIDAIINERSGGHVFCGKDGNQIKLKNFTEDIFYPALAAIGVDNPIVEIAGGVKRHKYTPNTCRHTFSTLMKEIEAPTKDKLELIGHTSEEMLMYYQDVNLDDLRRITDLI